MTYVVRWSDGDGRRQVFKTFDVRRAAARAREVGGKVFTVPTSR